ncbi:hypothetical protein Nepgr_023386 [Nepenthes gracilis]|uniref:Uncharacterized protein n=1 Tax=Nepenthes gracilis TaxID=150966 RepID=A0AAD3T2Y8_NEPGR|nr:hypothetical protein Nepgr_023386 [Nepenthes gracilis]
MQGCKATTGSLCWTMGLRSGCALWCRRLKSWLGYSVLRVDDTYRCVPYCRYARDFGAALSVVAVNVLGYLEQLASLCSARNWCFEEQGFVSEYREAGNVGLLVALKVGKNCAGSCDVWEAEGMSLRLWVGKLVVTCPKGSGPASFIRGLADGFEIPLHMAGCRFLVICRFLSDWELVKITDAVWSLPSIYDAGY